MYFLGLKIVTQSYSCQGFREDFILMNIYQILRLFV